MPRVVTTATSITFFREATYIEEVKKKKNGANNYTLTYIIRLLLLLHRYTYINEERKKRQ